MEEALLAKLLTLTALTAVAGQRVSWDVRPQADARGSPDAYVVLYRISGGRDAALDGEAGPHEARVQVDCWSTSWVVSKTMGDAVKALSATRFTQGGVTFSGVFVEDERSTRDHAEGQALYFRSSIDLRLWHDAA